jgi:hypothetical protein
MPKRTRDRRWSGFILRRHPWVPGVSLIFLIAWLAWIFVSRPAVTPRLNQSPALPRGPAGLDETFSSVAVETSHRAVTPSPASRGATTKLTGHKLAALRAALKRGLPPATSRSADWKPMERYRGLRLGPKVAMGEREALLLGARAVPEERYSAVMGPVLFRQSGFVMVSHPAGGDLRVGNGDFPVVVNPGNGRPGIVTGTLIATLSGTGADFTNASASAGRLAARSGLRLLYVDKSLGVAYFKAPQGSLLLTVRRRLLADPAVRAVEVETIYGRKVAR